MSVNELAPLSPTASLDDVTRALGVVIENLRLREPTSTGETRDKFVTWKDAEIAGIATFTAGGPVGGSGGTTIVIPGGPGGGGTTPDLSPPSPITNLQVSAGLSFHMITFDAPIYTQGGGNAYTEIFAANYSGTGPQPTFANAAQIATVPGRGSIITIPSEPGLTKHFWAGAVTLAGVRQIDGVGATGGTNGVSATTGQDPSYLLSVLSGQITESQLYGDLNGRINLVDGPDTLPGSVAARLLAEAQARGTAISNEATARQDADSAIAQSVTTLTATVNSNNSTLTTAIQNEATARANADSAEAAARQTLAAQVSSAINQVDSSWWAPGASLPSGWSLNGTPTENAFVSSFDHTGKTATLWRCTSQDPISPGEPDGGWDATLPTLDRTKTYRFMVPVRRNSGAVGSVYWGFASANEGPNAYFSIPELSNLAAGQWHWMVGYVYPIGTTVQNTGAGTYNAATGGIVASGSNFSWLSSGPQIHRAYLYYAEAGAQIDFGRPLVHLVDGNEPPLDAIIRGTAGAVAAAQALVQAESTARASADSAIASSITTLAATVGSNTAAIQAVSQATADLEGHVAASYSVRAQVTAGGRTAVGGFGLTGEVGASGPTITFGVVANQFWVGAPEGTPGINADILPFVIQTAPTVINGVTIPAGVYMDAAYITNLTALIARLGTAWIDNAMIANMSAGKITSGSIQVSEQIQSTGFVSGSAGWRIMGDGTAEFSGVIVRGTIYASAGTIGGAVIDSTGVKSANFVQGVSGWRLDNNLGKIFASSGQIGGASIEGERLVTRYGTTMKVEGAPFGTANQFVEWWGPILSDIALCSETNATIRYVKTDGDAYFGGSLAAGVLKNSARSTSTIATSEIEVGPFLTNGNPKTIVVSYGYSHTQQGNHGTMSLTGSGAATVVLERSLNGGAWTQIQSFTTPAASGSVIVDDDPFAPDSTTWSMGQAITHTDTSSATTDMRLRARITARTLMSVGGTGLTAPQIIQSLSVTSTEQ